MRTPFTEAFHALIPGDFAIYRPFVGEENFWRACDQVVCSMDAVKPIDGRRGWSREQVADYNRQRFDDLIAAGWELIIVDEAHRLGGSTDQVARYKLGQGLAEAAPHLLLLTARPHQGKSDAFHRLITLLDPRAFPDPVSVTRERVHPYVIRLYVEALIHPEDMETSVESVIGQVRDQAKVAREGGALLGELVQLHRDRLAREREIGRLNWPQRPETAFRAPNSAPPLHAHLEAIS